MEAVLLNGDLAAGRGAVIRLRRTNRYQANREHHVIVLRRIVGDLELNVIHANDVGRQLLRSSPGRLRC